jgi:hypothetical protein
VDSVVDFWRATLHAAREGERLLIERAVPGEEYRFLFLDGELLDVIRRRSTRVVGDGRSSVAISTRPKGEGFKSIHSD